MKLENPDNVNLEIEDEEQIASESIIVPDELEEGDRRFIKRIKALEVRAKKRTHSFLQGVHPSIYRGVGTEYVDLREYVPGDDPRFIDWDATAKRPGKIIVREYEIERNLTVFLLLDTSYSMLLGRDQLRLKMAVEACAALAFSVIDNKDKLGFGAFSDELHKMIPPKSGRLHLFHILKEILSIIPKGRTSIGDALQLLSRSLSKRSLIIVVTDFHDLSESIINGFRMLSMRKHEIQVLHVRDPAEYILPPINGRVKISTDQEEKPAVLNFSSPNDRGLYYYYIMKQNEEITKLKRNVRSMGIKIIEMPTSALADNVLLSYFSQKSRGSLSK